MVTDRAGGAAGKCKSPSKRKAVHATCTLRQDTAAWLGERLVYILSKSVSHRGAFGGVAEWVAQRSPRLRFSPELLPA